MLPLAKSAVRNCMTKSSNHSRVTLNPHCGGTLVAFTASVANSCPKGRLLRVELGQCLWPFVAAV